MLYVFHVDTGTTVTFDIKLALQSVSHLMEAIERECGVMANQQVLLMSGGLSLEPSARVCSYSVGTDTNPIYLFSKANIESAIPPTPSIDYGSDVDLQSQIDASIAMPATYETLVARAQLAQRCCALAREQTRICERLVFDQHLQQQGWATVVANLEDITQSFQSSVDVMRQNFAQYLAERRGHMKLLESFNTDLSTLSKIPILPALRAQAEGILNADDQQKPTGTDLEGGPETPGVEEEGSTDISNEEVLSLLRWIAAKDNQSSLEQVAEQSSRGLEQFDEKFMNYINEEVNDLLELATKKQMKNIHNIDQRLSDLEDRLNQSRQLVHEQGELAQGFQQNQIRASNLGDPSVLPDLCTSHRRQLLVMLQNHNQLRDIRRRIAKAKEELSANLYHRLKWVMYVENRISEVGNKLMMYNESLKRLRRHLEVLQQIHTTPEMYISAVSEVVRRRTFSQAFLIWASNLACQLLTVHNEELERRRDFQNKFDGHFLSSLFPGLEDTPPPFATQAPSSFDTSLPKLTADDMETLKTQLPDLAVNVSTPDLNSITQFFLSKSLTDGSMTEGGNAKDKAERMYMNEPTKETDCVRTRMLADRGGFESETDTEEFEKIGQGGLDSKPGSFDGAKQSTRQKQLEENLGNTRDEVERLRSILKTMKTVVCEALTSIRKELAVLRDQSGTNKNDLGEITERVRETLSLYSRECDRRLQEREQELTVDHELELGDVKKIMHNCNEELQVLKRTLENKETELGEHERLMSIVRQKLEEEQTERRNLQSRLHQQISETLEQARVDKETALKETNDERFHEIASLTASLNLYKTRIQELEEDLAAARADQQRMVKEATDKLQLEFKTELETIRSRFKLMTASNMERSPSDSSLEKIERPDVIELVNHEAILAQAKEDMNAEKSVAVRTAIAKERADCVAKMDHELRLARQIIEEKDSEVKFYRMREVLLSDECKRYKYTIRRLTKSENLARQNHNDKVENLEADKLWLTSQLGTKMAERKQHLEQGGSCESERQELRQELPDELLKMSQSGSSLDEVLGGLKSEKNIVEVSESKKVRLEPNDNSDRLSRRLEILENDNKRLERELQSTREDKETAEAKIDALEADKVRLEVELVKERSRRAFVYDSSSTSSEGRDKEMTASVSVVSESTSSRDAATSPELSRRSTSIGCFHSSSYVRKKLSKKTAKLVEQGQMTVTSCNKGDVVLVIWDPLHRNYTLYQESHTLYFLNSDCIESLNLGLNPDGTPRRLKTLARVVQKEYCHAKKPENRYRVPQGTKFYRVRVNPVEDQIDESLLTSSQQ